MSCRVNASFPGAQRRGARSSCSGLWGHCCLCPACPYQCQWRRTGRAGRSGHGRCANRLGRDQHRWRQMQQVLEEHAGSAWATCSTTICHASSDVRSSAALPASNCRRGFMMRVMKRSSLSKSAIFTAYSTASSAAMIWVRVAAPWARAASAMDCGACPCPCWRCSWHWSGICQNVLVLRVIDVT